MKKNRYFQLRLSDEERSKLLTIASSRDITASEFLRQAIIKGYSKWTGKKSPVELDASKRWLQ